MAPDQRRQHILEAVIPLLIEKGSSVTTAEMAQAAGIAEGTIFRVFPDKPSLIYEAVGSSMDPAPVIEAIRAIDRSDSLQEQLKAATRILLDHFNRVMVLGELLRSIPTPSTSAKCDSRQLVIRASAVISAALTELLERRADELNVEPAKAIAALRGLGFASAHPLLPAKERLTVDEVVSLLLDGITRRGQD